MQKSKVEKKKRKHWSYEIKVIGDKKNKNMQTTEEKNKNKAVCSVSERVFGLHSSEHCWNAKCGNSLSGKEMIKAIVDLNGLLIQWTQLKIH